jgi:hypothetical protein
LGLAALPPRDPLQGRAAERSPADGPLCAARFSTAGSQTVKRLGLESAAQGTEICGAGQYATPATGVSRLAARLAGVVRGSCGGRAGVVRLT